MQIIQPKSTSQRLTRREIFQKTFGLGMTLALPGLALGHPVHKHLSDAAFLDQADAKISAADWKPEFLSPQENENFAALAEQIVPGAAKAQVNRVVDLLLTVDTAKNQTSFRDALSAMEHESQHRFGHPIAKLTSAQQDELLTKASTAAKHDTLRNHFENLKNWTVGAYYASEEGMRELGWTEDIVFDSLPGCQHPEGHS